ncbi:hypothetical protein BUALT_Bualt13G0029400 [Buddleja alternifolia]|uniref:Cyclin-dependent kinase inhibitor n=1 Tax=Buddleja alternifolia TaxID=168488 RepID=A0AAV6WPP3_9LAMI|nr:hypothetical protein BUALT_Bualt13G0029400 [Buddleja alternifolia]
MGKFTRKAKTTANVAVMEVSQPSLGVRTRAKTLALRRLQSTAARPPSKPDSCYLQLRSRRLEKHMQKRNSQNDVEFGSRGECLRLISTSIEASFGENNLENEDRGRSTRESTPCSLIRKDDAVTIPGSTRKKTCSSAASRIVQNALLMNVPSVCELDEFFGHEEQSMQRHFIDKYNFDVVNDRPLSGRYEWVRVRP